MGNGAKNLFYDSYDGSIFCIMIGKTLLQQYEAYNKRDTGDYPQRNHINFFPSVVVTNRKDYQQYQPTSSEYNLGDISQLTCLIIKCIYHIFLTL